VVLKIDVKVPAEAEIELGAWLFLPKGDGIRPAITMAHGFAGVKEHGLERFAFGRLRRVLGDRRQEPAAPCNFVFIDRVSGGRLHRLRFAEP